MKKSQRANKVLATAAPCSSKRGVSCSLYYLAQTDFTILISYNFNLHLTIEDYFIKNKLRTQYDQTMSNTALYLTAIFMACYFLPVQIFKVQSAIM